MKTEVLRMNRRTGLIDLFKELGFKVGVEVGTDRGGYARDICKRFLELKLYTIDPWLPYNEGNEIKTQSDMNLFEREARNILANYNCEILKMTSMDAVERFEPESIDFVFIDGNHKYPFVLEDIEEWSKKVKPGGIICGHDYIENPERKYGVIKAVNEYCEENNIETLYILHTPPHVPKRKKGNFVDCWMFYKK
jgi:hypothetical protein